MSHGKALLFSSLMLASASMPSFSEEVLSPAPTAAGYDKKLTSYSVWIWQDNGDCLWRIAEKIYGDRKKWPLIYAANRDVIKDPNKIYPKQVLRIPPAEGQPGTAH